MNISDAQQQVQEQIKQRGYDKVEDKPSLVMLHLIEEVGETSRAILHKETMRAEAINSRQPKQLEEELADIFWQTIRLANILNIDLETAFMNKFEKNQNRQK
jgi:NTP pyrophosphatase (non-canonical NTP hydrolase)